MSCFCFTDDLVKQTGHPFLRGLKLIPNLLLSDNTGNKHTLLAPHVLCYRRYFPMFSIKSSNNRLVHGLPWSIESGMKIASFVFSKERDFKYDCGRPRCLGRHFHARFHCDMRSLRRLITTKRPFLTSSLSPCKALHHVLAPCNEENPPKLSTRRLSPCDPWRRVF